jgi:hypothetical protein
MRAWLRRFYSHWRRILCVFGALCALTTLGFGGWFLWALNASENQVGEIPFAMNVL